MSDDKSVGLGPRVIEVEPEAKPVPPLEAPPRVIETETVGPITPEPPPERGALVPVVPATPSRHRLRRGLRLALTGLGLFVAGWLVIDTVDWVMTQFHESLALGILAAIATGVGTIGLGYVIGSELRSFIGLKSVEAMQQQLGGDLARLPPQKMRHEIAAVLAVIPRRKETEAAIQSYQRQVQPHHTAAQQIELLSLTALQPLDRQAETFIRRAALQAFGVTAVSPTAFSDSLFFLACSLRMVRGIAECYGHRPGVAATAHLLRRLLLEAGTLGAADLVTTSLVQHLGGAALEHFAASAAETLYAAQRMARLGIITMGMCRPIPFRKDEAPGIAALLEHLIRRQPAP